jgi:hypothetical protein
VCKIDVLFLVVKLIGTFLSAWRLFNSYLFVHEVYSSSIINKSGPYEPDPVNYSSYYYIF